MIGSLKVGIQLCGEEVQGIKADPHNDHWLTRMENEWKHNRERIRFA